MLSNAYLLAKIGADTAENEQHFAEILPKTGNDPTGRTASRFHLTGNAALSVDFSHDYRVQLPRGLGSRLGRGICYPGGYYSSANKL